MDKHPIETLSEKYPQLLLPVQKGERETEEYKNAVLEGLPLNRRPDFSLDPGDFLEHAATPAGEAEILFLKKREDFEHAVMALAYRCEPVELPASMGASHISGLINWEKIHSHMREYVSAGGTDEDGEFRKFTSEKSNYLDTVILLSSGYYSDVGCEKIGLAENDWLRKSVIIRKYHELSHFFSRRLYPENREAIRDELVADMIGLIAAFGYYDVSAAELFMGIEGETYRNGGRLQIYCSDDVAVPPSSGNAEAEEVGASVRQAAERAHDIIRALSEFMENSFESTDGIRSGSCSEPPESYVFSVLDTVEKRKIGL